MKVQKFELKSSLKAEDFAENSTVIAVGHIYSIDQVKTKFDDDGTTSTLITITDINEQEARKQNKSIFANTTSINNLIDAYGDETNIWIGKAVKVTCDRSNFYNKKQLVISKL